MHPLQDEIGGMTMMDTAIIIPTFKSCDKTSRLISGLKRQSVQEFDIIVVDSGDSRDHFKVEATSILRFDEDLGGAGSFHQGLKYAFEGGYEKFILCDNDLVPIDVKLIEKIIDNLEKFDVVSPITGDFEQVCYHFLGLARRVVTSVGYPRKEFFMCADDLEYSLRLKKAGFNVKWLDELVEGISFYHEGNQKQNSIFHKPSRLTYYMTRNCTHVYLDYKRYPRLVRFLFGTLLVGAIDRSLKYSLTGIADALSGRFGRRRL